MVDQAATLGAEGSMSKHRGITAVARDPTSFEKEICDGFLWTIGPLKLVRQGTFGSLENHGKLLSWRVDNDRPGI